MASLGTVYRADGPPIGWEEKDIYYRGRARWSVVAGGISKRIIRPAIICVLRLPVADLLGVWHAIRRCSGKSDDGTKGWSFRPRCKKMRAEERMRDKEGAERETGRKKREASENNSLSEF